MINSPNYLPKSFSDIGQGCMGLGGEFARNASRDLEDVNVIKFGIENGLTFIDTAEVYADGHSEELVGEAIRGQRDNVFIATKFSPENSSFTNVIKSAENSLRRLRTDYIDLYQAHWPNPNIPIQETMEALEKLVSDGKIRHIGVSNFSKKEMSNAVEALNITSLFSNQVEYNLFDRFVDFDIGPYCNQIGVKIIAYSPLDKARKISGNDGRLLSILSRKYEKTETQIILNWLVRERKTIPIPKSQNLSHIKSNAESLNFNMEEIDLLQISNNFPSEPSFIDPTKIKVSVEGEGMRQAYQSLDEALRNELGHTPSPSDLAEFIKIGEPIKPVRLIPILDNKSLYDYELIEGRIRYWAWVIAYNWEKPIPAYVRI